MPFLVVKIVLKSLTIQCIYNSTLMLHNIVLSRSSQNLCYILELHLLLSINLGAAINGISFY